MVSAGAADTAFVEAVKELPAWGVQKPPRRVGKKRFPGGFLAAPAAMVRTLASLRMKLAGWQLDRLGGWRPAAWQSAAASWAAKLGVHGYWFFNPSSQGPFFPHHLTASGCIEPGSSGHI